jgi:hypothetical protein
MGYFNTYYSDYCGKPSCVYRLFDGDGVLLYVGMALRPDNRIVRHRSKPWGHLIASCTESWYPNREQAKAAERSAIHHEDPVYNLARPRMRCC